MKRFSGLIAFALLAAVSVFGQNHKYSEIFSPGVAGKSLGEAYAYLKANNYTASFDEGTFFEYLIRSGRDDDVSRLLDLLVTDTQKTESNRYSYGQPWTNPIAVAYAARNLKLVDRLAAKYTDMINMNDTTGQFDGVVPLRLVVETDDYDSLVRFLALGANVNAGPVITPKEYRTYKWPTNLLTVSKSEKVKKLLFQNGIATNYVYEKPITAICVDNNVRIRSEIGTSSKILGALNDGDRVQALESTFMLYQIDANKSPWIKIQKGAVTGWVYGKFLEPDDGE